MKFLHTTGVAATVLATSLMVWAAENPPPGFVTLVWPGENALNQLEKRYAKVITYEDPVWVWRGELSQSPGLPPPDRLYGPPHPAFEMPAAVAGAGLATDLANVLSVFHQVSDTKFGVQSSKLGFHVVPILVHDENGALVPAQNLLDVYVTVPQGERKALAHFDALCAAISHATGVKVQQGVIFMQGWGAVFGPDTTFTWGANSMTGREAAIDLLDKSATSLSWQLLCYNGSDVLHDHGCTFNVSEVPISVTDARGISKDTVLQFDRCVKCPTNMPRQLPPKQ